MTNEQTPPGEEHADLERALISGILIAPDKMFEVEDHLSPEMIRGAGRRTIFEAMMTLHRRNADIDLLSIVDEVERASGRKVPGIQLAVVKLTGFATSGSHVLHHARILRSRHVIDGVVDVAQSAMEEAPSVVPNEESVSTYLEDMMTSLYSLGGKIEGARQTNLRSQVAECFKRIDSRDGGVTGIRTGFYDLDDKLHGLRPGKLIVCGGRPAMGKSAFGTSIIMSAASSNMHESGRPARCALVSLEMNTDQIISRMLAAQAEVDGNRLFAGRMDVDERNRVMEAVQHVSALPLVIDDSPYMTVHRLRGQLRRIKQTHGLDLAVIDYIQLLHASGKQESRQMEVSVISRSLKALARELDIPIIALCQLSRQVEMRDKKRPQLADLRESGSLEQDADAVLFMYREAYYYPDEADPSKATVIVAKNRDGATGEVDLHFRPELTRFSNAAPVLSGTSLATAIIP